MALESLIVEPKLTRVLVAFATRFGSTREIVSAMVHELNSAGLDAHGAEATSSLNPDDYDAFVIGSPIYGSKWLAAAGMFAAITSERIDGKPVALFSVGTLGLNSSEAGEKEHKDFVTGLIDVAPKLNIVSDALFSGYFERSNLPWYLRIIDRFAPTPQGDHRDWQAIQSWTKSLVPKFTG
jgi:menaquinone-dependent protoporphyrinogen oxidase